MKNRFKISTTILSVLACFVGLPEIKAAPQVAPPPDGCYPGFTTAEGCLALQNLTTGTGNTGVGWRSLFLVGGASFNTGLGAGTLVFNTADSNTAVGAAAMILNVSGDAQVAKGFLVFVREPGAAHHLGADEPGAEAAALSAKRLHADAGHGRQHQPRGDLDRPDSPDFSQIYLHRGQIVAAPPEFDVWRRCRYHARPRRRLGAAHFY